MKNLLIVVKQKFNMMQTFYKIIYFNYCENWISKCKSLTKVNEDYVHQFKTFKFTFKHCPERLNLIELRSISLILYFKLSM